MAYDPREAVGADIVVGCDSMFEFDGEAVGKPGAPETARERIARMAGRSGVLHTGHQIVHLESGASLGAVSHAVVHFAPMTDAEVEAYVATEEPLHVAGAFTVDGLGGPFVERVDGDYHGVVGISLPLLRAMLANWGVSITRLWQPPVKLAGNADDEADGKSAPAGTADASASGGSAVGKPHSGRRRKGADGFILCPCGAEHWGLAGAAGILAFRERESIEVLVQLRAEWSHSGGTWSNPGGAIGWSETPLEGALREFEEETAIGADSLDVVGSIVRDHGDWRYTTFAARCETAEPVPNDESLALEWASLDDLLQGRLDRPVHPAWPRSSAALQADRPVSSPKPFLASHAPILTVRRRGLLSTCDHQADRADQPMEPAAPPPKHASRRCAAPPIHCPHGSVHHPRCPV